MFKTYTISLFVIHFVFFLHFHFLVRNGGASLFIWSSAETELKHETFGAKEKYIKTSWLLFLHCICISLTISWKGQREKEGASLFVSLFFYRLNLTWHTTHITSHDTHTCCFLFFYMIWWCRVVRKKKKKKEQRLILMTMTRITSDIILCNVQSYIYLHVFKHHTTPNETRHVTKFLSFYPLTLPLLLFFYVLVNFFSFAISLSLSHDILSSYANSTTAFLVFLCEDQGKKYI